MLKLLKSFWQEEDGMGTVEIVVIVAVLVGVALIFKEQITGFVNRATGKIFDDQVIDDALQGTPADGGAAGGGTTTP